MSYVNQSGFSLIELLVAISVTTVLLMVGGNFVITGTLSANVAYNQTVIESNTKTAVDVVARVIKSAHAVESVNTQPDPHAPVSGNYYSWSGVAGSNATLILAVPSHDTSGNLMWADGLHTVLYTDDVIFYLDPSSHRLYKRTVANAVAGNAAVTTCPPAVATSTCPADAVIVEEIAGLTTQYYNNSNAAVSIPSGTEAVYYAVTESRNIGSKAYSSTYSTIATLRNK